MSPRVSIPGRWSGSTSATVQAGSPDHGRARSVPRRPDRPRERILSVVGPQPTMWLSQASGHVRETSTENVADAPTERPLARAAKIDLRQGHRLMTRRASQRLSRTVRPGHRVHQLPRKDSSWPTLPRTIPIRREPRAGKPATRKKYCITRCGRSAPSRATLHDYRPLCLLRLWRGRRSGFRRAVLSVRLAGCGRAGLARHIPRGLPRPTDREPADHGCPLAQQRCI